jgi:hypothetical protein
MTKYVTEFSNVENGVAYEIEKIIANNWENRLFLLTLAVTFGIIFRHERFKCLFLLARKYLQKAYLDRGYGHFLLVNWLLTSSKIDS